MATEPSGRVITFYSYKGGTGRSMALANVGCILAQRQRDDQGVLMVDWDLEAPGLHRYFRTHVTQHLGSGGDRALDECPGLLDLFRELEKAVSQADGDQEAQSEEDADALLRATDLSQFILKTDIPALSLLKAGRFDDQYSTRVNTFQWETLYRRSPWLFRAFVECLAERYRYVLIDSRTGFTDSSGICTMLLPERLVVVFTPNRQSLTGLLDLIRRATSYRRHSDDLRPLVVFPLASRIEPSENALRQYWRHGNPQRDIIGYQPQFEDVFREVYGLRECELEAYFNEALIQHIPALAYGEEIAVLSHEGGDSLALARRYESFTECLVNALGPWEVKTSQPAPTTLPSGGSGQHLFEVCPYRGLATFHEEDAQFFFGRERVVDRLLRRLRSQPRFLAILGPSGSGKSSLIRAGLLPQLRQGVMPGSDFWAIIVARLADDPFNQLEVQGLQGASKGLVEAVRQWKLQHPTQLRLVLVLDQFEELLIVCPQALRQSFLRHLTQLLDSPLPLSIILAMRDDFYGRFIQQAPALLDWLERGLINLPPTLEREEISSIIQGPAAAVGLIFESGLVDAIIDDAIGTTTTVEGEVRGGRSTILPLLEFTLTQLWELRREGFLPHAAYRAVGGLTGALAKWAEEVLASFSAQEQVLARRVFTGLVQVGDESQGMPDSRRRRSLAELCPQGEEPERIHQIVRRLADARLLVTTIDAQHGQETVELIHEVLIHNWARLRNWVAEDREFLRWRQRLQADIAKWERTAHDEGALVRGVLLAEAERWLAERPNEFNVDEQEFIGASRAMQEQEAAEKEIQQQRLVESAQRLAEAAEARRQAEEQRALEAEVRVREQTEAAIRLHRRAAVLKIVTSLALGLVLTTLGAALVAYKQRLEAIQQRQIALASGLAARAELIRGQDATLLPISVLLAVEAIRMHPSLETDQALRRSLALLLSVLLTPRLVSSLVHDRNVVAAAFSPDGRSLATASVGTAHVWEVFSGREVALVRHEGQINAIAFSPDGRYLATASADGSAGVWELPSGRKVTHIPHPRGGEVRTITFSPDGQFLVTGGADSTARIWEAASGRSIAAIPHGDPVLPITFSPDGKRLVIVSGNEARIWEVDDIPERALIKHDGYVTGVTYSRDGRFLATASLDQTVRLWEPTTGKELASLRGHTDGVTSITFSPDGTFLASASKDGTIFLWDVATLRPIGPPFTGHTGRVMQVAFSPHGELLASASDDGTVRLWDAKRGQPIGPPLRGHGGAVWSIAFSPDARQLASASNDGTVRLWDAKRGQPIGPPLRGHDGAVWSVAFSPDGRHLATGGSDRTARVWNLFTELEIARVTQEARVLGVSFSPDGRFLAAARDDNTAGIWPISPQELINEACSRVPRNLTKEEWRQYLGNEPYRRTCSALP